jgi:site-specific DNA-methyltransferase (adenine-specific)
MQLLITGDCEEMLRGLPDGVVNLIVTSPPYADQRPDGIAPDRYVNWFLPKSAEFLRVLSPEGTFILNIKERVVNGERSTYVMELVMALRKQGWKWTEEFIWHKRNSHPGKWPNRFRDSWEHLHQFNRSKSFYMNQDAVKIPIGDWAPIRLSHMKGNDFMRRKARTGSGFGTNYSHWLGKPMVYPSNVIHTATESGYKAHNAAFPISIPDFFIRLFTDEEGLVLDPFSGSGTTVQAARALGRNAIGIDVLPQNSSIALERLYPDLGRSIFDLKN